MPALNEPPNTYVQPSILKIQDLKSAENREIVPIPERPVKWTVRQVEIEHAWGKDSITASINSKPAHRAYEAFLSTVSPMHTNRKLLGLSKVPFDREKKELSFVFFMNRDKVDSRRSKVLDQDEQRPRMHVLWPGSKQMDMDQNLIKDKYPVDVSIANYEDGYAPGELNVVLPSKKFREVKVSWAWSF
jgi:hypothetical protein